VALCSTLRLLRLGQNDPDDLAELLDARRRGNDYFSGFDEKGVLVGFVATRTYPHETNVGEYEFLEMERHA